MLGMVKKLLVGIAILAFLLLLAFAFAVYWARLQSEASVASLTPAGWCAQVCSPEIGVRMQAWKAA
jgi:hypothetical protein